tara:strand:+ start:1008 stop:1298 length:291 start_codon:yes stop_codon:yes gene_type:complete
MQDNTIHEITIDIELTDQECIDLISTGLSIDVPIIITESRRMLIFNTACIDTTIDLLSSLNLITSLVKLKGIYNYDINSIEDPYKYETAFEPEELQ